MNQEERERHIRDYLDGKMNPQGKALFDEWADRLAQDTRFIDSLSPAQASRFEDDMWEAVRQQAGLPDDNPVDPVAPLTPFRSVFTNPHQPSPNRFTTALRYGLAASVALLLLAGYILWHGKPSGSQLARASSSAPVTYREVLAPTGQRLSVTLPDGSKIYLNAESKLRYPKTLTGPTRHVFLEGEGFFEVAHNPAQPFVVTTSRLTTTVKGTSFNVNAYANESLAEVTVLTGKVEVSTTGRRQAPRLLIPGQRVTYRPDRETLMQTTLADPQLATAWRNGTLVFRRTPMADIVRQLSRQYGVRVRLATPALAACTVVGTFNRASLDDVLAVLCGSVGATYQYQGKEVMIRGDGCP
ncbi:FecR family protein [Spirosoma sordidisoli]|uniref:DUF4974 domain-containing protein n=1 Tax=Spirosoma sordidisoli TaxID=2502893 RepID=A0A4Q2UGR2_9BACT|nr:FecR domain-containing protein [Spirosoma sordidisoli]RYC68206.1 DUF4974 domain-containing protein [Spirosoma sordidisoli]